MIIGDLTYYELKFVRANGREQCLVRTSDFDPDMPCPSHAPFRNYLVIWRATDAGLFRAIPGDQVANYALQRELTLGEFCERYGNMDAATISAIKRQDEEPK